RLTADLSEYSAGVRGHVRMHANTSAIIEFLPEDLAAFTRAHPQVRIDIEERVSLDAVQAVRDGLTDIGIYAAHVGADGLQTRAYRSDRLVLVTPTEHPLADVGPIQLREAIEHDFVGLQQDASLHALIHDAARAAGKPLRMRVQVRSFEGICRMIACGLGIGVLPDRAVSTHVATLGLRTIQLADAWAQRELRIAYRDLDTLPVLAREMVGHLSASSESN
ncbi:MAG: LysR substrate-binding domain-containing protein, partial [Salinisphaera sp.]|uniref:LysR substrate-binding domain-containing protein n=1 Tax=Salinisphaera sp. TaxID=1914330 RepID=UPI003C7CEDAA